MSNISILISALIGLGVSSSSAFALPCAERYSSYREKLINEKYQPLECVKQSFSDELFNEICKNIVGEGVGFADWVNSDYNQIRISVITLIDNEHCVIPDFEWKTVKENRTTRLQKILDKLDEMESEYDK